MRRVIDEGGSADGWLSPDLVLGARGNGDPLTCGTCATGELPVMSVRGRGWSPWIPQDWWVCAVFASAAVLLGGVVGGSIAIRGPLPVSPVAVISAVVFAMALPFLFRHWRATLGLLLVWLMVEDLFRTLAGNDLRVYFAKDIVYVVLLVGLFLDPGFRRRWQEATGATRFALYVLVSWAIIMSVPSGASDWRLPLVGLRLDFMYAPLVVAGFAVGSSRRELRRWLLIAAVIAAAVSLIGIIQATIGPSFLSPGQETPGLRDELFRFIGSTTVYRPTATFVDAGRFASLTVVGLAVSLAAVTLTRGRRRLLAMVCVAANGGGVWVSGGRAGLIIALALLLFAATAGPLAEGRLAVSRALMIVASVIVASSLLIALIPGVIGARFEWYKQTLDPRSPNNEWTQRVDAYVTNTTGGLQIGGLFGRGTGTESLGKQYLSGDPNLYEGRYLVEGGYAALAVEWGVIGVTLWLVWSFAWITRQWGSVNSARGHRSAAAGFILFGWMLFFLFFGFVSGLQAFQNFVANAYFWLLSGLVFALPIAARDRRDVGANLMVAIPTHGPA